MTENVGPGCNSLTPIREGEVLRASLILSLLDGISAVPKSLLGFSTCTVSNQGFSCSVPSLHVVLKSCVVMQPGAGRVFQPDSPNREVFVDD